MEVEPRYIARRKPREEARKARDRLYRQHILDAAEKVFAERGFENAKLQEISRIAGLSMGTIYSLFASKEELFAALLDERGDQLRRLAREVASREIPARKALDQLIDGYIDYFVKHPAFLQMHLRLGSSWALAPRPGTDSRVRHWQEIHGYQTEIFRRGIAAGDFVDEDPAFLAKAFSTLDQVVLADWAQGGMKASRDQLASRLRGIAGRAFSRPVV